MDRRQIHHVEAHPGDLRQSLCGVAERATARGVQARSLAAREQFVPGAEQRPPPVGVDRPRPAQRFQIPDRVLPQHLPQGLVQAGGQPSRRCQGGVAQTADRLVERGAVGNLGAGQDPGALLEFEFDVHARRDLDLGPVAPGGEDVAVGRDTERPVTLAVGSEVAVPHVRSVVPGDHRGADTAALRVAGDQVHPESVVALPESDTVDHDQLTHRSLHRSPAAFDPWPHIQHGEPSGQRLRRGQIVRRKVPPVILSCSGRGARALGRVVTHNCDATPCARGLSYASRPGSPQRCCLLGLSGAQTARSAPQRSL